MKYTLLRFDGIYIFDKDLNLWKKIDIELSPEELALIQKGTIPEKIKNKIPSNIKFVCQKFENYGSIEDTNILKIALSKIDDKNYKGLHNNMVLTTSKLISESVTRDLLLVQAIEMLDDLNKVINLLMERFREWYEYYFPEISQEIDDHEKFIQKILNKRREELMRELGLEITMGGRLSGDDIKILNSIADKIRLLYELRNELKEYINRLMEEVAPNVKEIAGPTVGARLISLAGGLKELANLPASTIQVLGAEKALFSHLTRKTPPPKHGVIFNHPYIQKLPKKKRGAMARTLASKILIAAKVDAYSPGKRIADKLKKALDERFNQLKQGK